MLGYGARWRVWVLGVLVCLLLPAGAQAATAIISTAPNGITLIGSGTGNALADFGTVGYFGGVSVGNVSFSTTPTDFTLTTTFLLRAQAGSSGTSNVRMRRSSTNAITYNVNGITLTTSNQLINSIPSNTDVSYTLTIVVPRSLAPQLALEAVVIEATRGPVIPGTLSLTLTLVSSFQMLLNQAPGGVVLIGAGSPAAAADLGIVTYFTGCVTLGVTCAQSGSDLSVATTFALRVDSANTLSPSYNLRAALASADASNTWKLNTVTLSTTPTTVQTSSPYDTDIVQNLQILVPRTAPAGSVSRTLNLTAYAN